MEVAHSASRSIATVSSPFVSMVPRVPIFIMRVAVVADLVLFLFALFALLGLLRLRHVDVYVGGVQNFGTSIFLTGNGNRNSSHNRHFVKNRSRDRNRSSDRHSSHNRVLNVVDLSLVDILLHYGLSDDLFGRGLNSFDSILDIELGFLSDRVLLDSLVLLSVKFDLNVLSLNNRLNISLIDDLSSWSLNILSSSSGSDLGLSCDWVSVDGLSLWRDEIDLLSVIDYCSLNDWLGENFLCGGLEVSVNGFLIKFGWSGDDWVVDCSGLASLNIQSLSSVLYCGLDDLFSDGDVSGDLNGNWSVDGSLIDYGVSGLSLGVDWSWDDLLSNYGCLNYSLSYNWLADYSLGDDWLLDHFSGHYRFADYLLGLGDDWFWV